MRGFELEKARSERRGQLRRAAQEELPMIEALDERMLFALVAGNPDGPRGSVLRLALVFRGLRALGYSAKRIGEAFAATPEEVERYATASLLADPSMARDIEARVREEVPETPEADRYVEPRGNFALPGQGGANG
jgi:hypothetical protein